MSASTAVHSNAFNFLSFVQPGVDPRTGQYTVNLSLPEIKCNDLSGPVLPLKLGFNPLNTLNTGFGLGWELQLSQYDPGTQVLALSSGETFKVTNMVGNRLEMQEQKIKSFFFYEDAPGLYRVVHKSGMTEMLRLEGRLALPETLYSAEGYKINLAYLPYGSGLRRLHTVTDGQGVVLVQVNLPQPGHSEIELLLRPDGTPGGAAARFVMKLRNSGPGDEVYEVVLPTEEQASWRFKYQTEKGLHCITEVWTPVGGHEIIEYAGNGHGFPGNARAPLPRVFKHSIHPGFGQPTQEVHYSYDNSNLPGSSFNFIGNGSSISWTDDGLDNLYKITERYRYGTTETHYAGGVAVRSIERTFNRFHLLTEEKTTQGDKVHQVFTTYYADDNLDAPFSNQSPQCQLAKIVETRWSVGSTARSEKVLTSFDTHGNLTEQVQANGIKETYSYFPVGGVPGECPPDPGGFVRSLREKTVTPATGQQAGAPVLRTRHRYALMPPLRGSVSNDWLVLTEEALYQVNGNREELLQKLAYQTFNQPDNPLLHGRRQQQALTLNGLTTTTDYAYAKLNSTLVGETVLQTTETLTGFDHGVGGKHTRKFIIREDSLLHGQPLLTQDDNDVRIRYTYDGLHRVLSETVAPGDALYEGARNYRYTLTNADGQQASQIAIDVKGVQTRTLFDGLNRAIQEQRQDTDNRSGVQAEAFRDTYSARYNALGQLEEETELDWCSAQARDDLILTSRYTYDQWGEQCSVLRPDGVLEHEVTDPVKQVTTTWIEGMGKTVTLNNLFEKPDWVKRYTLGDDPNDPRVEPLSEHHYRYDGLGRSTEETDALSRTTRYGYDEFDRMIKSTLPDDVMVTRQYSPHSTGELPITIQVTPNEAGQQPIRVGTQTFDGLERLTQLNVGPRVETYEYSGSQFQVSKRTTPAGQAIDYFYVPELTEQPIRIETIEDKQSRFHYDPKTAYLGSSSNGQGQHDFDYDSAGNVTEHRWRVDGNTWTNHYRHSLGGRQLIRKDVGDVDCQYFYEKTTGRLHTLDHGYIQAQFEYDTQGRLLRTTCRDLSAGASLTTELGYDDLGRETLRTLTPNDQPPRILRQTWQADDRLQSRHLQTADGRSLLLEEFGYDQRGRLELHLCSGDELPRDRHGNEIIEQLFLFDALDNITLCRTTFKDDSRDEAEFSYSSDDACQLLKVTHTHPSYLPQSVEFEYDANGNMLNDEQGRSLQYDSQGRLVAVSDRHGVALTDYRYDPHNHLFGVKNTGQNETLRFYQNDRLSDTVQGPTHTQYLASLGQPLGQQQPDDAGQTLLLMTDGKSSVIGETQQTTLRTETYSGYGERDANSTMRSRMAFNGEVCEDITQWYLLGRGYRAYNPCLMRFHSPDSLSPFGAGGINPYMYCAGDPINFSDPTGHFFDSGWFHVFFGFVEALSGAATGNAVQLLAGTTQISAGLAMLTTDSDSDKQALGQVAGMASMIGLLSGVGRSGVVSLIKKPKAIPKITNKFYTTNNHFNTTVNLPRRDSSPAILQRGKAATRNQSTMTDVARRASAPTLSNSDDVLRRGSISVSNDAPFTTSEAYVEQVLSSNRLQAPTPPIPEQIESFTTSKPMKGFKAQSELTADVRQNAYRRSAGHSYPPPGAGVFNGAGGTLALRRN